MFNKLLKQFGFGYKYEELTKDEQKTVEQWAEGLGNKTLTIDDVKGYIASMRHSVEVEMTAWNLDKDQDLFLKARLRNLMMLDAFLTSPDKAKKAIERLNNK